MKQNDFITVHDEDNNDIIIINIKYIYRITVHETEPIIIYNYDNDNNPLLLHIKETPDKLYNKLKDKGYINFIKLHDEDNYPEIINLNYISSFMKDDDHVECKFNDDYYTEAIPVIEKIEKIEEIVNNLN